MKMKMIKKAVLGILIASMLVTGLGYARPMSVYAEEDASGNDKPEKKKATKAEKESAKAQLGTYTNNLIVSLNTDQHVTRVLKEMLENAEYYINNKFSGDSAELSTYVSRVQSQMDAVIAAIPASNSEFIALANTFQTLTVNHGQAVHITLPLVNYGTVELKDVVVKPMVSNLVAEWPFEPDTVGAVRTVKSFPPYDSKKDILTMRQDVSFDFVVRDDVKSGYYPMKFSCTYFRNGKTETAELVAYIKTVGKADAGSLDGDPEKEGQSAKPRIIVTGFETYPEQVFAGDTFNLVIHLKNTSKSTKVTNVLFDMQAVEEGSDKENTFAAFLPTSGSSSVYVDSIGPGASQDLRIEMSAKTDLAQKPYVLDVNMKYDAKDNFDLTDQASVSIPIYQAQRCETGDCEVTPDMITVGEQANLVFDVYNTGKTILYNVWVKFEGTGIEGGDTFLGNITPGNTGNVDAMVTAYASNMDNPVVTAKISFENESGNITTVDKTINLTIDEEMLDDFGMDDMPMDEDFSMDDMSPKAAFPIWGYVLIGLAVLIIILEIVVIANKRSAAKTKALALEDEDEEDEE